MERLQELIGIASRKRSNDYFHLVPLDELPSFLGKIIKDGCMIRDVKEFKGEKDLHALFSRK